MSQPAPTRRQLLIRWGVFLAILAIVWVARRREPAPADRAGEAERAEAVAADRTVPPPVEPRWNPPPRGPADDSGPGTSAIPPETRADAPGPEPERPAGRPEEAPRRGPSPGGELVIEGLSLRNADGRTIYRGRIDLGPTLERIAAGKRLRFPNDGATFQNRERRLPGRPAGYYREWVVPTPGEPGPGPQRVVTGEEGEVWYTSDHYRTFRRITTKASPR